MNTILMSLGAILGGFLLLGCLIGATSYRAYGSRLENSPRKQDAADD